MRKVLSFVLLVLFAGFLGASGLIYMIRTSQAGRENTVKELLSSPVRVDSALLAHDSFQIAADSTVSFPGVDAGKVTIRRVSDGMLFSAIVAPARNILPGTTVEVLPLRYFDGVDFVRILVVR